MANLTPGQAAAIARGVYLLRKDSVETVLSDNAATNPLGIDGLFGQSSRFSGTSGALMFKPLTGFGFVAAGTGPFAGDLLIATRGTAKSADWLTDFNVGMQIGPGGHIVHAGFNETWKSFAPELREFLRGRNPARIHCVGHSLGGALAFLNADFITANRIADVRLYTFGAPRTGQYPFGRQLTDRVRPENIFRVSNPCDPVPMIPLFPFFHVPFGEEGLQIGRTSNMPISPSAHFMLESYVPGVLGKSWSDLRVRTPDDREVQGWFESFAQGSGGFVMGTAKLLDMIARALAWMLKVAGAATKGVIGLAATGAVTILDQVAWLLTQAAQISAEMGRGLVALVGMIFRFLGRTVTAGVQITTAFLRWVLDLLFTSLRSAAQRALALIR
ncbi:MAG: lipase family protein [Burkholderiaceae bacterium]|jgi:triacylglycerol lipase